MKYLIILFSLLISGKGCGDTKNNLSDQEDQITFEYSVTSRGYYKKIEVTKEQISVFKNRNSSDPETKACGKDDWDNLLSNLKSIEVEKVSELEAPTQKRLYDGAAHAQLIISINDTVYTSNGFDHGFPPKAIEALVKDILMVSESIK